MTENQDSTHLKLLQIACQEFARNKKILKDLENENSDLEWIDNNLEIQIEILKVGKDSKILTRRRSSLGLRRTSLRGKGLIDLSKFKIEEEPQEENSEDEEEEEEPSQPEEEKFPRKSNAFSVDLTQFQDEDYGDIDEIDEVEEDREIKRSQIFNVNFDDFKDIEIVDKREEVEIDLKKLNFSKKKSDKKKENDEKKLVDKIEEKSGINDRKIISGLRSLIKGANFKKLREQKEKEKEEEEKKLKKEKEEEEKRKQDILEKERQEKRENFNIQEIDEIIKSRERPTFSLKDKYNRRGSKQIILNPLEQMKILTKKINSSVPIEEASESESDFSFESDREDEEEENKTQTDVKKPKVNLNKFGEEVGIVIENLENVFQQEMNKIQEPVIEQIKSNLHFSMVGEEEDVPNFELKKVTQENLYKVIQEEYGEISVFKPNFAMTTFVIGTHSMDLLIYHPSNGSIIPLKTSQKKYPTCIEFHEQRNFFIVGYNKGEIAFYKKTSDSKHPYKRILRFKDLEVLQTPVQCIKILGELKAMILSLEDGRLFYLGRIDSKNKLEKLNFNFRLVENGLMNSSPPHLITRTFRDIDFVVQTLGNTARVYVHKYSNKFKGMEKITNLSAPEGKSKHTVESFPFFDEVTSDGAPLKVICIHWGFNICYYSMYYGKGKMHIPLAGKLDVENRIEYVGQFEKGIYAVLTEDGSIYHYSIREHVADEKSQIDKNLREVTKAEFEEITEGGENTGNHLHFTNLEDNEIFDELGKELKIEKKSDIFFKSEFRLELGDLVVDQIGENYVNKVSTRYFECQNSQIVIVAKNKVESYSMVNWIEFLKTSIDKTKIFYAMKTFNDILELKEINLREIPENIKMIAQDIRPMFSFLIVKIWTHAENLETELKKQISEISMLLLLKAGMERFLLEDLKPIMIGFGYSDYYYENLYLFYLNKLIKFIDESMIVELLNHYKESEYKRIKLLYHAFTSGELEEFSLQQALVNRYYNLMVYFCSNDPSNSSLALNFIATDIIELYLNKNVEQASHAIYSVFWYIVKICLKDENSNQRIITKHDRQWLVLSWLYDNKMAQELVRVDIVKYLGCINFIIGKGIGEELNKLEGGLEFIKKNKIEKIGILDDESSIYLRYLLDNIYGITEGDFEIKVSEAFKRKTLFMLLDEYKEIGLNPGIEMNEDDILLIVISLFLKNREQFDNDLELIEKVKTKEKKIQVITHIINGDYKSAFTQFQRNVTNYNPYNLKLFEWISQGLENPSQRQGTLNLLSEEYIYLIKKNHAEFSKVLKNLTIEEQMNFIMKYKPTTKSKLNIFKNILNFVKTQHKENDITEDFKIEYINLLNIYEPKQVLVELLTGKYPMSQCLELCKKSENMLPVAYLKERLGFFKEALDIYKERLAKSIKALTKGKRNKDPIKRAKLVKRIERETALALNLCENAENSEKVLIHLKKLAYIRFHGVLYNKLSKIPET